MPNILKGCVYISKRSLYEPPKASVHFLSTSSGFSDDAPSPTSIQARLIRLYIAIPLVIISSESFVHFAKKSVRGFIWSAISLAITHLPLNIR